MVKIGKQPLIRDREKTQAVNWAASKFRVSSAYVYGILRGDYNCGNSDEIKKATTKKYSELKKVLAI